MKAQGACVVAATVALTSCVAYNTDCPPDESAVIGQTETVLDLRHSFVRTHEAPIGNLITDAFYDYLVPQGAELALVNGGSIRDRTDCSATDFIDRGPIRLGQLVEILPFDNKVALVEVTGRELAKVLEQSVARLGDPGEPGMAGQFLQVSHLRFDVDCAQPAQVGDQVGNRVRNIEIRSSSGVYDAWNPNATYVVATNSFLSNGGDGYVWLRTQRPLTDPRPDFAVVASYIAAFPGRSVAPTVDGRIHLLESCVAALP